MDKPSSVNNLSHRFREMSFYRNCAIQDGWKRPLEKEYVLVTSSERSNKPQKEPMQTLHNAFARKNCFYEGAVVTGSIYDGRKSNVLYNKNSFFSLDKHRDSSVEYNANRNNASDMYREPKNGLITHLTGKDRSDANGVHVQWNTNQRSVSGPVSLQLSNQKQASYRFIWLVKAVANARGVRSPPIPREVIIAYENCVRGGTAMLKFVRYGAPHERFFVFTFLEKMDKGMPVAVLCWYKNQRSRMMKRYLLLADLVEVIFGSEKHPAIHKRKTKTGMIKGSAVNLSVNYLKPDFILQWRFRNLRDDEEVLAAILPNKESFIAWYIVSEFFSTIGTHVVAAS